MLFLHSHKPLKTTSVLVGSVLNPVLFAFSSHSVGMSSQPNGIACGKDGLVIVACLKEVGVRC